MTVITNQNRAERIQPRGRETELLCDKKDFRAWVNRVAQVQNQKERELPRRREGNDTSNKERIEPRQVNEDYTPV